MKLANILMASAIAALTATAAMADTVRMGTEGAYPPYNLIDENGEVGGFERELGDELCSRAGLECTWVVNDWDSIIPNLVSGNYDTIMAGMSVTEERMKTIDFSEQYTLPDPSAYVALTGSNVDLNAGTIAAQAATIQAGHVASSGATLLEFASPDETIAAIKNGEADAVLADHAFLAPIVAESNGELSFVGENVMIGGGIGVGVRKSDAELRAKFDAAIISMKADGTLNAMITKHLGADAGQF